MTWVLSLVVLLLAMAVVLLIREIQADRRRRHIASVMHRHRSNRIKRSLKIQIDEPDYPGLKRSEHRSQKSTNENSPEFHKILKDLRFTHFWKSEAWRWEEAHKIRKKQLDLSAPKPETKAPQPSPPLLPSSISDPRMEELVLLLYGDRKAAERLTKAAGNAGLAIAKLLRDRRG